MGTHTQIQKHAYTDKYYTNNHKKEKKCEIGTSEIQRSYLEGKEIYKRHEKIRRDSPGKNVGVVGRRSTQKCLHLRISCLLQHDKD